MAFLEVEGIRAGYGVGPDILDGVSLEVEAGRTYCIIGPNGAGKSTLLKVICGLLHPRAGAVRLEGERLDHLRPDQILRKGVCFVPQGRSLFPGMTVRENLVMGGFIHDDKAEVGRRIAQVFEMYPVLEEKASQRARNLSGGQQQMLALGRALMVDPKVLMIDEPSLGLAPQLADQIFGTIRGFREMGMTVLLVEQNARKGLECSEWGCVLDLGRLRFQGPAEGILEDPRIRELYLGRQLAGAGGAED